MLFRPDQSGIGRLANRNKKGYHGAYVCVESDQPKIDLSFPIRLKSGMLKLV